VTFQSQAAIPHMWKSPRKARISGVVLDASLVGNLFTEFYGGEFFIDLSDGSPDINWVKNSNLVAIGWAASEDTVIAR
jgi:N-acetyl-gamma-glutamylphosphate reductase